MNTDPVDAIMQVMQQAFDPAYGEAWTRRQIADALLLNNTHYLLAGPQSSATLSVPKEILGFALSRHILDEEELLLIAVKPGNRRGGVARGLMEALFDASRARGSTRIFLEMRDGNPAKKLYTGMGFEQVGRRPAYYRGAKEGPLDAVTFAKSLAI